MRHPIQPVALDEHGVIRFVPNKIIEWLMKTNQIDLNKCAAMFHSEPAEYEQLAMLMGYSLSGFAYLSSVSDETYSAAMLMYERGITEDQARAEVCRKLLQMLRDSLREPMAELFGVHSDDLISAHPTP